MNLSSLELSVLHHNSSINTLWIILRCLCTCSKLWVLLSKLNTEINIIIRTQRQRQRLTIDWGTVLARQNHRNSKYRPWIEKQPTWATFTLFGIMSWKITLINNHNIRHITNNKKNVPFSPNQTLKEMITSNHNFL